MSLSKAIQYGKEHRKSYYGSAAFDGSCRPHGSCGWCLSNRQHSNHLRRRIADEKLNEYLAKGADSE